MSYSCSNAIVALAMEALLVGCSLGRATESVPLALLEENPARYDGHRVLVHGHLIFGREGDAVCNGPDDAPEAVCIPVARSGHLWDHRNVYYETLQRAAVTFVADFVVLQPRVREECEIAGACVMIGVPPPFHLRVLSRPAKSSNEQ